MKFWYVIFLLTLVWLPGNICSQQYGFRDFSLEEGLPQSEIQGFIQDSRGIIWAGTNGGGLVRFNGDHFDVFTTRDGLPDNIVYSVCEDGLGNIWIGSMNSIARFDGHEFTVFRETPESIFRAYNQIFADRDNRIWAVSLEDEGLLRLVTLSGNRIEPVSDQYPELSGNMLNILFSTQGTVYISTPALLYELKDMISLEASRLNDYEEFNGRLILPRSETSDGDIILSSLRPDGINQDFYVFRNGKLSRMDIPDNSWFNNVGQVFKDSQQRIWFSGFGNGIAIYEPEKDDYSYYRQDNGLKSDFILGFLEDHEGNIWMGSRGSGLIKYSLNSFISFSFENYIEGDVVRDIYQDGSGDLWFGLAGTGLVKYDGQEFHAYSKNDFPGIHNVRGMTEIRPGVMMLASINGLYHFNGRSLRNVASEYGIPPNMAFVDLHRDADTIWLSSINIGLARIINGESEIYSVQSGHLESNFFNGIFKDSRGDLWFCSNDGIGKYRNGNFEWLNVDEGLSYPITLQMTEDRSGRLWIATYMEGIDIYDGKTFRNITTADGLISNNIYSIMADANGDVWAGTANGVNQIILDGENNITEIKSYGIYDGFTGIECNGTAIYIDNSSNIWFGTVKGAMRFDPKQSKPNLVEPRLHITDLDLFLREADWNAVGYSGFHKGLDAWENLPQRLVLPHDSNHLSFEFEAASYQVPEKVRYQWKLDGLDKDWSPVSEKTEATYANLPPGEYTFLVKGMNNDGVWSSVPASYSFEIRAPWWGTWYFALILGVVILSGIIAIFQFRIRMIEARRQELERIVEEQTREVREQNKKLEQQKEEISAQADRLQTSYNNLENLSEIGKMITSQLTVEKIVETVYESINDVMDATVFGIGIVNREKNSIEFAGVKEKGVTLDALSFSLDDKLRLSSYCVNTRKEILINDFEKEYIKYLPAITPISDDSGNSSSILYIPLIVNNDTKGVITVQSFEKNAYTEYHLSILRNLAVYTKIALENANAYEKIEHQSRDLRAANQDISKQKEEIEATNKELLELNTEKNHLIGIVAHDLRNPLTSSLTIAETMKSAKLEDNPENRESLGFLVNALKRMNDMISKILDIRMIEQKKINVRCEQTDLGAIVEDVYRNMKDTANSKNIKLHIENKKVYGFVDRNYTTQVFENLLSNAIKFSPRDSEVTVRVEDLNGEVLVNFIDQGPGIRKDEMDRLFGKYQRLSARPTAGEASTGLGLSIVKKYVDVMGGKVWCESRGGKGANFIVSFRKSSQ